MAGFSNQTIKAPVKYKPHICMREGWWRVSPIPEKAWPFGYRAERWRAAHVYVRGLNQQTRWFMS